MVKEFEFKCLINNKGFYCKITYEVSHIDKPILEFDYKKSDSRWKNSALFAAKYFFEKYSQMMNSGIKIGIIEIESQIVDTNDVVILFTVIEVLSKEFNYVINGFKLNEFGDLILPK